MKAIIAGLGLILLTTVYAQNQYIEELHAARAHLEKILTNGNVGQDSSISMSSAIMLLCWRKRN